MDEGRTSIVLNKIHRTTAALLDDLLVDFYETFGEEVVALRHTECKFLDLMSKGTDKLRHKPALEGRPSPSEEQGESFAEPKGYELACTKALAELESACPSQRRAVERS